MSGSASFQRRVLSSLGQPDLAALWRSGFQNRLLAGVRRRQQLVKPPITVQRSQQRVGHQVGVRAVVPFDGDLQLVKGSFLLSGIGEKRS